jgi:iron complex transport system substrate-binding protein
MKKIISLILVISLIITTGAFAKVDKSKTQELVKYPLKVVDGNKRTITIEKEPQRIISLSPTITESIFTIGKGSKLVGRTTYCDYPAAASKVSAVGSITNPSLEKIIELKPDLVLASDLTSIDTLKKLEDLKIKVLYMKNEESFNGVYATIKTLGDVTNSVTSANRVITSIKYRISTVTEKVKSSKKRPSVYYVVGFGQYGDYTATGDTFISNMIGMAGGKNAAVDGTNWKYSLEKLIEKNPDILICSKFYDSKKGLLAATGYKDLKAVKSGKLIEIDENFISRQGPRIGEGLYKLAKIIHPELFK